MAATAWITMGYGRDRVRRRTGFARPALEGYLRGDTPWAYGSTVVRMQSGPA